MCPINYIYIAINHVCIALNRRIFTSLSYLIMQVIKVLNKRYVTEHQSASTSSSTTTTTGTTTTHYHELAVTDGGTLETAKGMSGKEIARARSILGQPSYNNAGYAFPMFKREK